MSAAPRVTATAPALDPRVARLTAALQAEAAIREAKTSAELGYVAVNELHRVVPFGVAAWLDGDAARPRLRAVTGLAAVDPEAGPVRWLLDLARTRREGGAFAAADLPAKLAADWPPTLPANAILVKLRGAAKAQLVLFRDTPWQEADAVVLAHLGGALGYANERLAGRRRFGRLRARSGLMWLILLALVVAPMFIPVRQSVVAPAEVVPLLPTVIAAPQSGAVREVMVRPGQDVAAGEALFRLDDTEIRGRHEVALRSLEVTRAELLNAQQRAHADERARAALGVLQARIRVRQAEAATYAELLSRMQVAAPRAGVVVMGEPGEWIGRPVRAGERVLALAAPRETALQVWLPVGDAIALEPGAEVRFYSAVQPLEAIPARLTETAYESELSPDQVHAYRLRAGFDDAAAAPRLGIRGTAKLMGEEVSLFWYLMRRPIGTIRRTLGV